ncbi:MAG: DivIVA domain-containing protein [Actinomycetota bacterium]
MDTPGSDAAMRSAAASAVPPPGFKLSRRGFDQGQVLEYIGHLTARLQTVEDLQRRLRSEADMALKQRDAIVQQRDDALRERDEALRGQASTDAGTYEQVSDRVTGLLVNLDREVEKIRTEAETQAGQIVADARSEAHRMRLEAEEARNAAAHEAKQARDEAARSVADLTVQREDMLGELRRTCDDFLEVIGTLAASIGGGKDEARREGDSESGAVTAMPTPEERADRTVVLPDVLPDRPA